MTAGGLLTVFICGASLTVFAGCAGGGDTPENRRPVDTMTPEGTIYHFPCQLDTYTMVAANKVDSIGAVPAERYPSRFANDADVPRSMSGFADVHEPTEGFYASRITIAGAFRVRVSSSDRALRDRDRLIPRLPRPGPTRT
jgi:hypothetical protein